MKVKLAFLHSAIQIPGVINTETTLSDDKVKGIEMTYDPKGLLIEVKGKKAVIPLANVKVAIFADDVKTK